MSIELWTIVGTQIATWVTLLVFVSNRLDAVSDRIDARSRELRERIDVVGDRIDARSGELRREFSEQLEAQGQTIGVRIDALTARFDAHLERHAT